MELRTVRVKFNRVHFQYSKDFDKTLCLQVGKSYKKDIAILIHNEERVSETAKRP